MLPKPIRIIGIAFCIVAVIWAAQLCIRRAIVCKSDLRILEGKVIDKRIAYSPSGRTNMGRNYHVEFQLENREERIGINFPTDGQVYQDSTIDKIDTGKSYKFYLDETYPTFFNRPNGTPYYLNKGIDIIEENGVIIFSKSHNFELGAGIFFILLSVTGTFFAIKFGKWKNGS